MPILIPTSQWQFLKRWKHRLLPPAAPPYVPPDEVPMDYMQLRKQSLGRRFYEKVRPLKYAFKMDFRNNREFLYDFMAVGPENFIGLGSYKFVYRLPGNEVVKLAKNVLPSDPIFGSLYFKVAKNPRYYLTRTEYQLMNFIAGQYRRNSNRERICRSFYRLGLERLHYEMVRAAVPDLVLPTRFFMATEFREMLFSKTVVPHMVPADTQPFLIGKHLKEFVDGASREPQGLLMDMLRPRWNIIFKAQRFGQITNRTLKKLKTDLERLIRLCQVLAYREKLIIDLHSENLIITLPDFQIRIFDFHLFDTHLYEPEQRGPEPEKDHIHMISQFLQSIEKAGLHGP